ncbi:unnamed protein product [Ostreobium quekettii]|uniref:NADP-dependent oxidoreductase domain-containing protein n=1 Tax=Ostreobium quekettii TaxID=121088 RepID=A0A8S1J3W0_9CHLO|nr:unnamed protein product [Ostreobium quekettii]
MQYRNLGRTGLKVSVLSFGAWVTFGEAADVEVLRRRSQLVSARAPLCSDKGERAYGMCYVLGILVVCINELLNLGRLSAARLAHGVAVCKLTMFLLSSFDNAEVYAGGLAETVMGQAIKELGWKRSDLVISTKIFWGGSGVNDKGLSRKHLIEGLQVLGKHSLGSCFSVGAIVGSEKVTFGVEQSASLKRLQMDYVDVLFCHRPDDSTPIEETVRAMNYLLEQGKIFYWGTSEWSAAQITQACEIAKRLHLVPPIVEQPEYHMFERTKVEVEFAPLYEEQGIGLTTWSPLASGVLTGKYSEGKIPEGSRLALDQFKIEDNLKAMEVLPKLTPEVMEKIESIIQSKP